MNKIRIEMKDLEKNLDMKITISEIKNNTE